MTGTGETGFGGAALTLAPGPAPATTAATAAGGARPPLSLTRAAHGYPGGIEDAAASADDGLLADAETEQQPRRAAEEEPGAPSGVARTAVWQRSLAAWQDAGIDWQPKAAAPTPADRDWSTEPIPVITLPDQAAPQVAPPTPEPARAAQKLGRRARQAASGEAGSREAGVGVAAGGQPGGAARRRHRVAVAAVVTSVVVVGGVIVGVTVSRSPGAAPTPAFGPVGPYPPALSAEADFAGLPAASLGSVRMSLTGVAAAGNTVIAVGSPPGLPAARPMILVSTDGGDTWRRASLAPPSPAGPGSAGQGTARQGSVGQGSAGQGTAQPPASSAAAGSAAGLLADGSSASGPLVAGGGGRWLALGDRVGWVSADGTSWRPVIAPPGTGVPGAGLPGTVAGDRVAALARTSGGFLAVGENVHQAAGHPASSPVIWSSPDGITWQRSGAPGLAPGVAGGQVLGLRQVAAHGQVILIAGQVARQQAVRHAQRRVHVNVAAPALWRSDDGGATWQPAKLPAGRGADGGLAGIAATRSAFVAVRTGHNLHRRRDAVAFVSAAGAAWRPAARLIAGGRAALWSTAVAGGEAGVAVTAVIQGQRVAFVSNAAGTRWHRTADLGGAYARPFTGVTVGPGGTLVAAGMDGRRTFLPDNPRPFLLLANNRPQQVGQAVLGGTGAPDVFINELAGGAGRRVAVGSADGAPAAWVTTAAGAGAGGAGTRGTAAHGTGAGGTGAGGTGASGAGVGGGTGASGAGTGPAGTQGAGAGRFWTRAAMALPHSWNGGGAGLTSAAPGRAGWFAVGSRSGFGRVPAPRAALPRAIGPGTGGGGSPADSGTAGQVPARPLVMTSRNGLDWRAAPDAAPLLARGVTLAQVASGPAGYVVVGGRLVDGRQQAAAWHSADLTGWASARDAGQGDLDGPGPRQMLAVTAEGTGAGTGFLAAGYAGGAPAVWASPDGGAWRLTALPVPTGAVSAALTAVTASGHRLAATGTATTRSGSEAFAATSADGGRTWHESLLPLPRLQASGGPGGVLAGQAPAGRGTAGGGRTPFSATALTAADGGFVATGVADAPSGQDVLIWWSQDGMSWHAAAPSAGQLHGPGAREITALAAAGHSLTAIGYTTTPAGQHPIRWQPRLH